MSRLRWGRVALVVVTVVLVQVAVVDGLRLPGSVRVDLPLLLVLGVGLAARPAEAALVGFATGLLLDLHQLAPLGLLALVYAVAAWSLAESRGQVLGVGTLYRTVQGAVAAVSVTVLLWVSGWLLEQDPGRAGWPLATWLVGAAVTGAVGVHPATAVARWLLRARPLPSRPGIERTRSA